MGNTFAIDPLQTGGGGASTGGGSFPGAVSLAASTTATQAGATQIPLGQKLTNITGPASSNVYLTLPTGAPLGDLYCVNTVVGVNNIIPHVFPPNSGKITFGGAAAAKYDCSAYGRAIFLSEGGDNWNVVSSTPGYYDNLGGFSNNQTNTAFFGLLSVNGGITAGQGTYAAAGTNQATATAISSTILRVYVNSVAAGTGVILPAGYTYGLIINAGANALLIYPDNGFASSVNSLGVGVGYSLAAGAAIMAMSVFTGTVYNYRLGVLA